MRNGFGKRQFPSVVGQFDFHRLGRGKSRGRTRLQKRDSKILPVYTGHDLKRAVDKKDILKGGSSFSVNGSGAVSRPRHRSTRLGKSFVFGRFCGVIQERYL